MLTRNLLAVIGALPIILALPSNYNQVVLNYDAPKLEQGWIDPRINGGQFLDVSTLIDQRGPRIVLEYVAHYYQFTTKTKGEPLNVIISAKSDPFVLTDWGLHYYAKYVSNYVCN